MVEVLRRHHGIIVDFLGDAILAFFDPLDGPLAPVGREALQCALSMQQAMLGVNLAGIGQKFPSLHMGIGLHAGEVVVGNIGSETQAESGIVGVRGEPGPSHPGPGPGRGGGGLPGRFTGWSEPEVRVTREFEVRLKGIKEPVPLYVVGELTGF